MKLDRLIGILAVLQQCSKTTAPALAQKFEVSRRTISRDIDTLCQAGIPIVTTQGGDGGIALMEGFQLDTTVFTQDQREAILIGLQSISSVDKHDSIRTLTHRFGKQTLPLSDYMNIDLSSFYRDSLADKIDVLKSAIHQRQLVCFRYYSDKGEADKQVEPYQIVFRWSDWYLFGFCLQRQDFRLYKLRRLWRLSPSETPFLPRPIPIEKTRFGSSMTDDYLVTARYAPSEKYRLVEQYGPDSFTVQEDGSLHTCWGFSGAARALQWFLPFGDRVEVLEPPEMRALLLQTARQLLTQYQET